jgi:hypothetical protein
VAEQTRQLRHLQALRAKDEGEKKELQDKLTLALEKIKELSGRA